MTDEFLTKVDDATLRAAGYTKTDDSGRNTSGRNTSAPQFEPHQTVFDRFEQYADDYKNTPPAAYCGDDYITFSSTMPPCGLCFIGGEPGSGKTSFLLSIAANRILDKKPTILMSFEMSAVAVLRRLAKILTKQTKIISLEESLDHKKKNDEDEDESFKEYFKFLTIIEPADTINENGTFDFDWLAADVARIREQYGANVDIMLIVDSLNMLDVADAKDERRAVNVNCRLLSKFTKTQHITTICIAQNNRQSNKDIADKYFKDYYDDKKRKYVFRPLLYSFRESSLIEYIADCVYYVLLEEEDTDDNTISNRQVVTLKHRDNSPNKHVGFEFNRLLFTFDELEKTPKETEVPF